MSNITKVYPNGVVANNNASLEVEKGEIHAVAGENGAGKSTIMKVLYGAEKAQGDVFINGVRCEIDSPKTANGYGIGMVYQHFMLVNEFSVWENMFFGNEIRKRFGILDRDAMRENAMALCCKYGMELDVDARCSALSVSEAQKAEILKVLAKGARTIILDEPTAVLTPQETQQLFTQLLKLKEDGYTIIIITHKLKEIKQLCDRVTVMRQGRTIGTYDVSDVSESDISRLMVGREICMPEKTAPRPGSIVLEARDLDIHGNGRRKAVHGVSFCVREGEILCFVGVEGNGQHEIVNAITGIDNNYDGDVFIKGTSIKNLGIDEIRHLGLAHIPEDRLKTGAVAGFSVFENLIAVDYGHSSRAGFIDFGTLNERCRRLVEDYGIKGSLDDSLGSLSGGNMQKVVVARELDTNPCIVVADQPTRGVDIGAIESIHGRLLSLKNDGKAIVLVSADLSEVFSLADRIIVFHNGEITAQIQDISGTTEEQLGRYMLGIEKMEAVG